MTIHQGHNSLKNTFPGLFAERSQAFVSLSTFMRDPNKKTVKSAVTVKTNLSVMASKYEQWFLKSQCRQDLNEMQSNSKIQKFSPKNVVQKMLCEI